MPWIVSLAAMMPDGAAQDEGWARAAPSTWRACSRDATVGVGALPEALRGGPAVAAGVPGHKTLSELEREHIARTIRAFQGNKAAAARALGLDRKTLYRKLEHYKIPS